MTDSQVSVEEARRLANDVRPVEESGLVAAALDSLASQIEDLRKRNGELTTGSQFLTEKLEDAEADVADLRSQLEAWLELGDAIPVLPDGILELRRQTRRVLGEG